MTTEGMLLTCDRCGKTTFVPKVGTQFNAIDGYCEESPTYEDHDRNWDYVNCYPTRPNIEDPECIDRYVFDMKMLCPSCRKELVQIMYKFWRIIEV